MSDDIKLKIADDIESLERYSLHVQLQGKEIGRIIACGCWIINLAQGQAFLVCTKHQEKVLAVVKEEK